MLETAEIQNKHDACAIALHGRQLEELVNVTAQELPE